MSEKMEIFEVPLAEGASLFKGVCYVRDIAFKQLAPDTWFEIRVGYPRFMDPDRSVAMLRDVGYFSIPDPKGELWELPITPTDLGNGVDMAYSAPGGYWLAARLRVPAG